MIYTDGKYIISDLSDKELSEFSFKIGKNPAFIKSPSVKSKFKYLLVDDKAKVIEAGAKEKSTDNLREIMIHSSMLSRFTKLQIQKLREMSVNLRHKTQVARHNIK